MFKLDATKFLSTSDTRQRVLSLLASFQFATMQIQTQSLKSVRLSKLSFFKRGQRGRLILSKKRAQYERAWGDIEGKKERDEVVVGTVIEVVKADLSLTSVYEDSFQHLLLRCAAYAT